ncbi:10231_t:CDS:2, partial [Acaulospora colombiana]
FLTMYDSKLKDLSVQLERVINRLEHSREDFIKKLKSQTRDKDIQKDPEEPKEFLGRASKEITPLNHFRKLNDYSIPSSHEKLWNKYAKPLFASYNKLSILISDATNPPYKLAYDSAVSSLQKKSELKIDELIGNIELLDISMDNSPVTQDRRLQESLEEVGIVTPKIDRRIYLDAFLEIVNIQKVLFHEVSRVIPELRSTMFANFLRPTEPQETYHENWLKFSDFLIKSIKKHLKWIIKVAKETNYKRHSVLASLELAEFRCTIWRFRLKNQVLSKLSNLEIKKLVNGKCDRIGNLCSRIQDSLREMDLEHFERQCNERVDKIHQDVLEL